MDIGTIGTMQLDATMQGAKFNKKIEELSNFKDKMEEAEKKINVNENNDMSQEDDEALKEMCKEFEQYFFQEMYKSMKKTVNYKNIMGYGQGEEIFGDMLDQKYAEEAVKNGGIGLATTLYNQLKARNQNVIYKG